MIQASTLKFLKALKKNNNKPWFDKHRADYEAARNDFEIFIQGVIDKHGKNDTDLKELVARKCMFRINRDIRFSKDKTPYKKNFAASLDKGGKKSGLAGYYFHLEPGHSFLAGGLWMPPADALKKLRQEIDYCVDEFRNIVENRRFKTTYGGLYTGEGVQLSKLPRGVEKDNPAAEYLKFKSWLVLMDIPDSILTSKELLKRTVDAYSIMQPFIKFLNRPLE